MSADLTEFKDWLNHLDAQVRAGQITGREATAQAETFLARLDESLARALAAVVEPPPSFRVQPRGQIDVAADPLAARAAPLLAARAAKAERANLARVVLQDEFGFKPENLAQLTEDELIAHGEQAIAPPPGDGWAEALAAAGVKPGADPLGELKLEDEAKKRADYQRNRHQSWQETIDGVELRPEDVTPWK